MFRLDDLPDELPVFPLTGALLLPKGHLPLHISESRYLDMLYYAHEHDGLVGLIQPIMSPLEQQKFHDKYGLPPRNRPLYTTGCVGMISDFGENKDGSLTILLSGISRFDVTGESPHTEMFRKVKVHYDRFSQDCVLPFRSEDIPREIVGWTVKEYLKLNDIVPKLEHIENASDEEFINGLAMMCPFEAVEKQALLETIDLKDRAELMLKIMGFDLSCGHNGAADRILQ